VGSDQQSYPDNYPCPPHSCWTGASAFETLGYSYQFKTRGNVPMDAVYRIDAIVPHSRPLAGLQFAAIYHDKLLDNQSWGIDNLQVQVLDDFQTLTNAELEEQWRMLVHNDPVKAVDAVWSLVAAGDSAAVMIVNKLRTDDEKLQREIAEGARLLDLLMKVEPRERDSVIKLTAQKLAALNPRSISALQVQFATPRGSAIEKTFEHVEAIQLRRQVNAKQAQEEAWRLRRAKRVLSILDTPIARRALWTLSEPGKFDTGDEQYLETQLRCD
jgi:hypothetical protein